MIKYCLEKWNNNKAKLQEVFENGKEWDTCYYSDIVKAIVENILNDGRNEIGFGDWNASRITEIDDGDYQGTLLYLIPRNTYQPDATDYLITFVEYGSCSGCDTLQTIQSGCSNSQTKDFMALAKDIVMNMRKPFNYGWRCDKDFDEVKMDEEDE